MQKFLVVIFMLLITGEMYPQKDVTTFLGIPVDGTKKHMKRKLKKKGFTYNLYKDCLEGIFNDRSVEVHIVTNKKKVYRIAVFDAYKCDESTIKIRYNNLCHQFKRSGKYLPLDYFGDISDLIIPDEEDISKEMSENSKTYEAIFCQNTEYANFKEITEKVYAESEKECIESENGISDEIMTKHKKRLKESWDLIEKIYKKSVWFKIDKEYEGYRILMFYDNEYNKSNGEDL